MTVVAAVTPTITMTPALIKMISEAGPPGVVAAAGTTLLGGVLGVGVVSGMFTTYVGVGVTLSDGVSVASGTSVVCVGVADLALLLYFRSPLRDAFFLPEFSDFVAVDVALLAPFLVSDEPGRLSRPPPTSPLPMGSP